MVIGFTAVRIFHSGDHAGGLIGSPAMLLRTKNVWLVSAGKTQVISTIGVWVTLQGGRAKDPPQVR